MGGLESSAYEIFGYLRFYVRQSSVQIARPRFYFAVTLLPTSIGSHRLNSVYLLVPKSTECYRDVNLILCSVYQRISAVWFYTIFWIKLVYISNRAILSQPLFHHKLVVCHNCHNWSVPHGSTDRHVNAAPQVPVLWLDSQLLLKLLVKRRVHRSGTYSRRGEGAYI